MFNLQLPNTTYMKSIAGIFFIFLFAVASCTDKKEKSAPPPPLIKKEKGDSTKGEKKGPIINVVDTLEQKRVVLCIKDSAATSAGMSVKLNSIYNKKLPDAIRAGKLKATGQLMAWYKTQKAPFFFEAGIPIDKAPTKPVKGTYIKTTGGDSVLIAHFFGPYDMTQVGYDALNEMLKDRHKSKSAPSYEIYVKNPFEQTVVKGKPVKNDPYKNETDIVLPYH